MLQALIRWVVPLVALLGLGPLAWLLTGRLRAPDGGRETSLLLNEAPARGLAALAAAMALALAAGVLGAWSIGKRSGLFCAGLVLAWAAWGTGRVDRLLSWSGRAESLYTLALEGALVGALTTVVSLLVLRTPTRAAAGPDARDPEHLHHHLPEEPSALWDTGAPAAVLAALAAGAVVVWLLAQETLKGQTVAAATVGGLFAAAAGRVASQRVSGALFVGAMAVLMAASPAAAALIHSSGAVKAALAGTLYHGARLMPLDWAAGALMGVPLGLSWAASMIEKHQPAPGPTPGPAGAAGGRR